VRHVRCLNVSPIESAPASLHERMVNLLRGSLSASSTLNSGICKTMREFPGSRLRDMCGITSIAEVNDG
jgi:hypothetical protein